MWEGIPGALRGKDYVKDYLNFPFFTENEA